MKKTDLKVEYLPLDSLIPYARNSRTHSEEQVAQIAGSIREFGFTNPVLIDAEGGIIAGHGRVLAARKLGLAQVPCIRLGHLTEAQRRAYVIADNKLALNAGWDENLLMAELDALTDMEFDIGILGFTDEELGQAIDGSAKTTSGVKEVQTSQVYDRFWISVRGPLERQAEALQKLQALMADMPLEIELGTVPDDEVG